MFDLTLTFDNGPEPAVTPEVLAVLAERGILGTFFVLGHKLADPARRRLAEQAHGAGHWIGNHTWSHGLPLGERADPAAAAEEIGRTQALLGELAHPDRLFRPNGKGRLGPHLLSGTARDYLAAGRFTCVLWNAVPHDWDDPDGWVEVALAQCRAQPWSLLVLHDLPTGAMRHLARFLDAARDAGARFRQDFPPACLPLVRGRAMPGLEACVSPQR